MFVFASDKEQSIESEVSEILQTKLFCLKNHSVSGLADSYTRLGAFYERNQLLDSALVNYKRAFHLEQSTPDEVGLAKLSMNIGNLLLRKERGGTALTYYKPALAIFEKTEMTDSVAAAYLGLANVNVQLKNYPQAERLVLRYALPVFSRVGNDQGRLKCFRTLAKTYYEMKKYSQSKWFFIQENMLSRKINDKQAIIRSLISLGHVKMAIRDYVLAINDFKVAQKTLGDNSESRDLHMVYRGLSEVYKRLGDLSTAKKYSGLASAKLRVIEASEQRVKELALQSVSKMEETIAPDTLRHKTAVVLSSKINHSGMWIIGGIVFVIILVLLFFLRKKRAGKSA